MPEQQLTDDDLVTAWGLTIEAMAAARRLLEAQVRELSSLSPAEFEVLLRLLRSPDHRLPTTKLAREVSFSSGGFTKLADRLVAAGLVDRTTSVADRRVIYTELTDRGAEVATTTLAGHVTGLRESVLAILGSERVEALGGIMRVLRDALAPPCPEVKLD
jgi:DNA-binding MarR family transcriptional regulator